MTKPGMLHKPSAGTRPAGRFVKLATSCELWRTDVERTKPTPVTRLFVRHAAFGGGLYVLDVLVECAAGGLERRGGPAGLRARQFFVGDVDVKSIFVCSRS